MLSLLTGLWWGYQVLVALLVVVLGYAVWLCTFKDPLYYTAYLDDIPEVDERAKNKNFHGRSAALASNARAAGKISDFIEFEKLTTPICASVCL